MMRSPSFSRSMSSTTTTISPALTAATAASTEARPKQYPEAAARTPSSMLSSCDSSMPFFTRGAMAEFTRTKFSAASISPRAEVWFMRATLASRYRRLCWFDLGATMGCVDETSTPRDFRRSTLRGLLVSSCTLSIPMSSSIDGTGPYVLQSSGKPRWRLASTVSSPMSCMAYAATLLARPIPRPSCCRYITTPPSRATKSIPISSCSRQSQRWLPNTSEVRHWSWTRTGTFRPDVRTPGSAL
mmetsp:Transcript_49445/g.96693  ORF Transcript_49445/g.96693 Transcript_49445/m.96693 type:complete len:243 (-) Transcript_49445:636-1364(-)